MRVRKQQCEVQRLILEFGDSSRPSGRNPVPPSRDDDLIVGARTSTQVVLPP